MTPAKVRTTIVTGPSAAARETAILAALDAGVSIAVLLEGVPDGSDRFHDDDNHGGRLHGGRIHGGRISELRRDPGFRLLPVVRIAPGCLCCIGNLAMRVHLNRLLREKPQRLFIGISTAEHLAALQKFLSQPPYDALLDMTEILQAF
ncbi:MAG TPA: GTPase [Paucimonas sp.]|nr:GTPase [Paucimonas sp.]